MLLMKTSDFDYFLPPELIAQSPAAKRSDARLLVYERQGRRRGDYSFADLGRFLRPGDVLVRNTTRVIPARLFGFRPDTMGRMEFLLLKRLDERRWECLVKPGRRAKEGRVFRVNGELSVEIGAPTEAGGRIVYMHYDGIFEEILERAGETPLPPYIRERSAPRERYQTVYAKEDGSAAAPTAGLHFTEELLDSLRAQGVGVADVLLHVGLGTFRPVESENLEEHHMHAEYYRVTQEAAEAINGAREKGGRIVCVGTTSCRTLESCADAQGRVQAGEGWTDIFITPGYRFKATDCLITNFHLPASTLLMLVSALCSRKEMLELYAYAVEARYRFFSFGDAMLIL